MTAETAFPAIAPLGLSGLLVRFADKLSEPANRAALAFRAAVEGAGWAEVEETATALASTFVRFDPLGVGHTEMSARLTTLLATRDWYAADLPGGRRHWRIPTAFGGTSGPQLVEAAALAGVTPEAATQTLSSARVRVIAIGYAPGQPYLGTLPPEWDIPRQTALTRAVPEGALVVAVRQFVLFSSQAPTGWRHVGQTAFCCFRPETDTPFALRPGDEVTFTQATAEELERMRSDDATGNGGAVSQVIR
jgi:KipI family sensor histidine kinase inhibitor